MFSQLDLTLFFGASFIALSVDHPLSAKFNSNEDFKNFKKECNKFGTTEESLAIAEKLGFDTNLEVKHPFIKIKNSCLFCKFCSYGLWDRRNIQGPAHDQRDFDFAKKYDLEIIKVVSDGKKSEMTEAYTGNGKLINSYFLNDLNIIEAKKIIERIENEKIGVKKTLFTS